MSSSVIDFAPNQSTVEVNPERELLSILADSARKWLSDDALPLWWDRGFDWQTGTWCESLDQQGRPTEQDRRARVQGRQTYVFALADRVNIAGPWDVLVHAGFDSITNRYMGHNGLLHTVLTHEGMPMDPSNKMYDQTFVILALATARHKIDFAQHRALEMLVKIEQKYRRLDGVGFVENCQQHPFQSNAHMHLFEAAIAWVEACREDGVNGQIWEDLAAEIAELARTKFIDANGGFLREFFNAQWRPKEGPDGTIVEPGHQFEWAWLLARWAKLSGEVIYYQLAERLFRCGAKGINQTHGAAVNTMDNHLNQVTGEARLWPQTEWLKAASILFESAQGFMRCYYLAQIEAAYSALEKYLDTPVKGLWFDKLLSNGDFEKSVAPASSFYHIACAIDQLLTTYASLSPDNKGGDDNGGGGNGRRTSGCEAANVISLSEVRSKTDNARTEAAVRTHEMRTVSNSQPNTRRRFASFH
ncbi:MAG: AGE family epimerase/isomerase [Rhizobiaceae bacterium]|nr:AGE family epimerase/isomerase [Hyphomicrobiales bacterium]NRB31039.1 AGE family epimerase/isomerase [Rhizobiaceae bacterium]